MGDFDLTIYESDEMQLRQPIRQESYRNTLNAIG